MRIWTTPRSSEVAYVLIKLLVAGQPYFLLKIHHKWGDWSFVGGHVEPNERHDWILTAVREAEEELEPLHFQKHFVIKPLLLDAIEWGPENSRSAGGAPTYYRARFYVLEFALAPTEVLRLLKTDDFLLIAESHLMSGLAEADVSSVVPRLVQALPAGLPSIPLSWKGELPASDIPFVMRHKSSETSRQFLLSPKYYILKIEDAALDAALWGVNMLGRAGRFSIVQRSPTSPKLKRTRMHKHCE